MCIRDRSCVANSEPAKPIVSSIRAIFCSATDTSCFVSASCSGLPSALIQDCANSFTVGLLVGCLLYTSNITPQMPKLLPVGFNIQSVITLEKDILQVVYVYKSGTEPYYNQDGGAYIIYRSSKLTGDISGDHKIHKVIETERVDSMKVTFKGSDKMVYLASVSYTHLDVYKRQVLNNILH